MSAANPQDLADELVLDRCGTGGKHENAWAASQCVVCRSAAVLRALPALIEAARTAADEIDQEWGPGDVPLVDEILTAVAAVVDAYENREGAQP